MRKKNNKEEAKLYWINTSENKIIKQLVERDDIGISNKQEKVESLLRDESLEVDIDENVTFRNLYTSESTFFTILFMTGYLTKHNESVTPEYGDTLSLSVPNKEIKKIIDRYVRDWFRNSIRFAGYRGFFSRFLEWQ